MPTIKKKPPRPFERRQPRIVQGGRKNPNNKFYTSSSWRALRAKWIALHPLCQECQRLGITKPADVVDHIKPINQGGGALEWSNLQSMCHTCHNKKSGRESRG